MSAPTFIVDNQLPLSEDFKSLRKEGLDYIQEYTGNEWTNLNASDPGVTILDQVCFALTELGYCNSFPVEDILTLPNGELRLKDQFYLPEDILTTSPVTAQDYIKYLADGLPSIKNAIITAENDYGLKSSYKYQVYLLIDKTITGKNEIKKVCEAAFYYLNSSRNLGEIFLAPLPLIAASHFFTGEIEIESATVLEMVLAGIDANIQNYIFPAVVQSGYDELVQNGFEVDEVFNGPLLQNGWIATDRLGKKQDHLNIIELTSLITKVPGVKSVSDLNFDGIEPSRKQVSSKENEIIVINLAESRTKGLNISWPGKKELKPVDGLKLLAAPPITQLDKTPARSKLVSSNIQMGAGVKVQTEVPLGKYRDIDTYYSIQNTFPEVFAVGPDATISNASSFQMAQSRQLKGYLTLFDQVLANQFSQLANIGGLFSFKNSMTGTPSDVKEFYAYKDSFEKAHPEYPVPYLTFSPTYFYQSLYDIPYIRPLLKDNDIYKFSNELESDRELEEKSWVAYKLDPYNSYIRGLMKFVEEEKDSLIRRNNILDHLLARHGESPLTIDMTIKGSVYSGDSLKDQVIFKSLYLQNLGLLSYFRQKAYNYIGANKIANEIRKVPLKMQHHILGGDSKDFIFNSAKVNHREKLTEQDFIDYSAIELKLNMLFGLKSQYQALIVEGIEDKDPEQKFTPEDIEKKEIALWMITERRGSILIEMDLLLQHADFEIIFKFDPGTTELPIEYQHIAGKLNYGQAMMIAQGLIDNTNPHLITRSLNGTINLGGSDFKLENMNPGEHRNYRYAPIPGTDFSFAVTIKFSVGFGPDLRFQNDALFFNRALFIFPDFVPQFVTPAFQSRLKLFLQESFPVQMPFGCLFIPYDLLKTLIPLFANWHNALVYDTYNELTGHELNYHTWELANLVNDINAPIK